MTTNDTDGPGATGDSGSDPDIGRDPMHPHPQDDPDGEDRDRDAREGDDRDSENRGKEDAAATDRDRASPGIAATRPMDAPGEVPEPTEPS